MTLPCSLAHPHLSDGLGRGLLGKRLFGRSDLVQRSFPATFEFGGDQTIIGVDPVELALGQRGGISLSLELAFGARRAAPHPPDAGRGAPLTARRARPAPGLSGTRPPRPRRSARRAICWQAGKPSLERR